MARLKYKLDDKETRIINTKFGVIEADISKSICFPQGIVGINDSHYYHLGNIPENKLPGAYILQSLDKEEVGFITLPLAEKFYIGEDALLKYEDVRGAAETYEIDDENLMILVIAKIARSEDGGKLEISINLKAPIFLDSKERFAYQHVFISKEYPVNYKLSN